MVAIAGPSGSGKSSLLYVLAGLLRATSGAVSVGDYELTEMDPRRLARFRCLNVGFIFQSFQLLPHLWAWENVALPMVPLGIAPSERRRRACKTLIDLGLGTRLTHRPGELSAGEQQRVAMGRAIVNSPSLVLADEPTGNLDAANAAIVVDLLKGLVEKLGATVVCATHDDRLAAQAQIVARMAHGELIEIEDRRWIRLRFSWIQLEGPSPPAAAPRFAWSHRIGGWRGDPAHNHRGHRLDRSVTSRGIWRNAACRR